MRALAWLLLLVGTAVAASNARAGDSTYQRGNALLDAYFRAETKRLADRCLADVNSLDDWTSRRAEHHRQLAEMLGLDPMPERTDLKAVVTGTLERPDFTVERVQFQSRPGLYVTGNLFLPPKVEKPLPAILYVCGHSSVVKNGISYGNKVDYQHHGEWFARHGYVCLTIDTLQLGEIRGLHHGTHPSGKNGMWWWNSRGYTPAGVECWNGIRAIDYLQSRPEVDRERIGMTGRSGGGAYTWYVAAMDERVKVAVPVAGITDLQNHVVDGTVEGHCDCMFMVNTYGWDYPQLAAMVAPRPLLISNSDKDTIFPLDGVYRLHQRVAKLYKLYGAADKLGLLITEGPHADTQDLQVPAFRWFDRFLKGQQPLITVAAEKLLEPEQLRVFKDLPADQRNTTAQEWFVPMAHPAVPETAAAWEKQRDEWRKLLRERTFRAWPAEGAPLDLKPAFDGEKDGVRLRAWDFTSQAGIPLRLWLAQRPGADKPELTVLNVLDEEGWKRFAGAMRHGFPAQFDVRPGEPAPPPVDAEGFADLAKTFRQFKWAMAYVAPRGIGPTALYGDPAKLMEYRRRYQLLGQTQDAMRVWDVRRALQSLKAVPELSGVPLWLQGERGMSPVALYAAVFEPGVARMDLWQLPKSHMEAQAPAAEGNPDFLNALRFLDIPQALALAAEHTRVIVYQSENGGRDYPEQTAAKLNWDPKQFQIRVVK